MPTAITPLANITLTTGATTITFSSISGSYRDLYIVATGSSTSSFYPVMQFNNDTSSNYSMVVMGGAANTATSTGTYIFCNYYGSGWVTSYNSTVMAHIMDYSATDKHKTVLLRSNVTDGQDALAARWGGTAAITSIKLSGGTFAAGSTFALYGVSA